MRIALISPIWERTPPPAYGGTEAVVHVLGEGLVARGHQVVLYASGDSLTSAEACGPSTRAACARRRGSRTPSPTTGCT